MPGRMPGRAMAGYAMAGRAAGGQLAVSVAIPRPEVRRPVTRQRADANDTEGQVGLRAYLGYLAVAFLLAVALSWSYTTTARLGYRINELQAKITALEGQNEKLSYELSSYQSVARVEQEATRLGMTRPDYVRPAAVREGTGWGTDAASASGGSVARVIRLSSDGGTAGAGEALAAAGTAAGPARLGLWERFYRWLTGVSQAEARDWQ